VTRVVAAPLTRNEICGVARLVISTVAIFGVELSESVTLMRYCPSVRFEGGTQRYSICPLGPGIKLFGPPSFHDRDRRPGASVIVGAVLVGVVIVLDLHRIARLTDVGLDEDCGSGVHLPLVNRNHRRRCDRCCDKRRSAATMTMSRIARTRAPFMDITSQKRSLALHAT